MSEIVNATGDGPVVAALDVTPKDEAVLAWAAAEAERSGVGLRLVSVVDAGLQVSPYEMLAAGSPSLAEEVDAETRRHLDGLADRVRTATPGVEVTAEVPWGSPAAALVEASEQGRLLVVGSPAHAGFGSVVVPVMAHARCPVVVVPDGARTGRPRSVVVGVDGSEPSRHALDLALAAVDPEGGSVTCVAAWRTEAEAGIPVPNPLADPVPEVDERQVAVLDGLIEQAAGGHPGVRTTALVRHGSAWRVLLDVAREQDADLVAVGSRGHGGFAGLLLGSVSRRVVAKADRPVAVVH